MTAASPPSPAPRLAGLVRLALNASLLALARVGGDGLSLLLFVAVARVLGPDGSGLYSYAFAIATLVGTLANPLLQDYGVRTLARAAPPDRRQAFAPVLVIQSGLLGLSGLVLACYLLAAGGTLPEIGLVLALAVFQLSLAVARTLFVPAFADEAVTGTALVELGCRAAAILGALGLLLLAGASLPVAAVTFALAAPMAVILATRSARARLGGITLACDGAAIRRAMREMWPIGLGEIVGQIQFRTDILLLTYLLGEAETGRYAAGLKLVEAGTAPLLFLVMAAFPRLSRGHGSGAAAFVPVATGVLRATLLAGGAITLAFWFFLPFVIVPVFGERFAGTLAILPWMGLRAALLALEISLLRLLIAVDRQVLLLRILVVVTVLNLGLNLLLIPTLGTVGAAAAGVLTLTLTCLGYGLALAPALAFRIQLGLVLRFALSLLAGLAAGLAAGPLLGSLPAFAAALLAYGLTSLAAGLLVLPGRQPG